MPEKYSNIKAVKQIFLIGNAAEFKNESFRGQAKCINKKGLNLC